LHLQCLWAPCRFCCLPLSVDAACSAQMQWNPEGNSPSSSLQTLYVTVHPKVGTARTHFWLPATTLQNCLSRLTDVTSQPDFVAGRQERNHRIATIVSHCRLSIDLLVDALPVGELFLSLNFLLAFLASLNQAHLRNIRNQRCSNTASFHRSRCRRELPMVVHRVAVEALVSLLARCKA
jgi:hypothetical protein